MAKEKKVRERVNWHRELRLAPGYIILTLWVLFTFFLLGWVVAASFSTSKEIFSGGVFRFESGIHLENYAKAWSTSNVSVFFMNSLVYAAISCVLLVLICAPAAYVLSRFTFLGNKLIQNGFVAAMGVPATMIVLPLFGLVAGWNILNVTLANRAVLVFLYVGINVPYTTIFLLTFFSNLSRSFEEAAAIDGCPPMKTFWKIMLPMAQPGIITVTIFNFINVWNEYFMSLIFANSDKVKSAAVVIVFLPTFILYVFLSEKIIAGVTGGGVKG